MAGFASDVMPCFFPLPARRDRYDGRVYLGRHADWSESRTENAFGEALNVPCGTCVGCRARRAREWAIRCGLELGQHSQAVWSTLTYSDDSLPPCGVLVKAHLSGFLKRLRARMGPDYNIRFFACGEYGERTGRPHYHAILFGVSDVPQIQACWPFGHVYNAPVTPATIAYTAGYASKKLAHFDVKEERIDYSTGEIYVRQPPFLLMSRGGRPRNGERVHGIGGAARELVSVWRKTARFGGIDVGVPRYLHEEWKKFATPSEIEALAEERKLEALDREVSFYSLAAGRKIAEARQLNSSLKRSL